MGTDAMREPLLAEMTAALCATPAAEAETRAALAQAMRDVAAVEREALRQQDAPTAREERRELPETAPPPPRRPHQTAPPQRPQTAGSSGASRAQPQLTVTH